MSPTATTPVTVWTLTVRLTHWSVAALVVFNLFFNDTGGKVHRYAGYVAAACVGLRAVYGLFHRGKPAALHVPYPSTLFQHAAAMRSGRPPRVAGHNPLGAAMSLMLWLLILLLALTGWISRWDRFWGADWPIDIHNGLSIALQICVLLHLAGVIVSSLLERQNLATAMITGRKVVDSGERAHLS